ncbi:hypothetical protein H310_10941 [Aphanomyces invadans]|uniref:C2H2-type domain-containing protein n=1 Tax=Aphanomyces invadans TaxID=157072 RepID=A0A024TPC4_9STRA|nr:hypothetical protein H310_10941 [Aphanomyces invadans]ETV95461.1 hypothetical protein H310_10941 [Aphanomyces invadans]|eukprot:XP_008875654.1 hypothetical protein H310_10941 [Aphanomyces invadans]
MANTLSPLPPVASATRANVVSMVLPPLRGTVTNASDPGTSPHDHAVTASPNNADVFRARTPLKAADRMLLMTNATLSPLKNTVVSSHVAKQWHRCDVCNKSYEREESLAEHMTRHRNQMKKRQQRMQEDMAMAQHVTKAARTLNAPCVKTSPAVRLKLIP